VLLDEAGYRTSSHRLEYGPPGRQGESVLIANDGHLPGRQVDRAIVDPRHAIAQRVRHVHGIELPAERLRQPSRLTLSQKGPHFLFRPENAANISLRKLVLNQPLAARFDGLVQFAAEASRGCGQSVMPSRSTIEPSRAVIVDLVRNFDRRKKL
jgi:hypothetical protein